MLEALSRGLPAPPIVDRLVLVEVAYQDPLQATEGQLTYLRPAREIYHRNFVNHYPACGVFSPSDRFVGEMVDGERTWAQVMGCQVRLGEHRHPFSFVSQELNKLSC